MNHVIGYYFGLWYGAVWGNLLAAAIWAAPVTWRLIKHQRAARTAAEAAHAITADLWRHHIGAEHPAAPPAGHPSRVQPGTPPRPGGDLR